MPASAPWNAAVESLPPTCHGCAAALLACVRLGPAQTAFDPSKTACVQATAKAEPLLAGGTGTAAVVASDRHPDAPLPRRCRVHTAMSRSRRGEPALHTRPHTHACDRTGSDRSCTGSRRCRQVGPRCQPQREEKKKEKEEKKKRARTGPAGPRTRRAQEDFRPEDAIPFPFFFLHGTDTRVPPVGETR